MKKILQVQEALMELIEKYDKIPERRDQPIIWEKVHMASSARLAYMMAEERGVDPVKAACACSIHDIGRIINGRQEGHAEAGYEPAKLHIFARRCNILPALLLEWQFQQVVDFRILHDNDSFRVDEEGGADDSDGLLSVHRLLSVCSIGLHDLVVAVG